VKGRQDVFDGIPLKFKDQQNYLIFAFSVFKFLKSLAPLLKKQKANQVPSQKDFFSRKNQ